jgi:hypothetical protein
VERALRSHSGIAAHAAPCMSSDRTTTVFAALCATDEAAEGNAAVGEAVYCIDKERRRGRK